MYDLTKISSEHREVMASLVPNAYLTQETIDKIYEVYVALADIPKKDWDKPETIEAVQQVVDENIK